MGQCRWLPHGRSIRDPRSYSPSFLGVKLASCAAVHHSHIGTSYRTSRQVHQNIGTEEVVLSVVNWTLEACTHPDKTAVPETDSEVSNRLNQSLVIARGRRRQSRTIRFELVKVERSYHVSPS